MMQFTVLCPVDGQVTVGIADIASMVVRDDDTVDVVFECPQCGTPIQVSAHVPHVLLASLEEVMVIDRATGERKLRIGIAGPVADTDLPAPETAEPSAGTAAADVEDAAARERIDAYCEYFRRQLETASTVEDFLTEIDDH